MPQGERREPLAFSFFAFIIADSWVLSIPRRPLMSIIPANQDSAQLPLFAPPESLPDYDSLITEDDKAVDSIYAERQHRLLTDSLAASWQPPGGRPHFAATDVGLFFGDKEPPLVPDVMVSLDVSAPSETREKGEPVLFHLAVRETA
jgi:hypothetical protein